MNFTEHQDHLADHLGAIHNKIAVLFPVEGVRPAVGPMPRLRVRLATGKVLAVELTKEVLLTIGSALLDGDVVDLDLERLLHLFTVTLHGVDVLLNEIERRDELTFSRSSDGRGRVPIVPYVSDYSVETVLTRDEEPQAGQLCVSAVGRPEDHTVELTKEQLQTATAALLGGDVVGFDLERLLHLITVMQYVSDVLLNELERRGEVDFDLSRDGQTVAPSLPYMSDYRVETVLTRRHALAA